VTDVLPRLFSVLRRTLELLWGIASAAPEPAPRVLYD
jgi:hypothetical protein